LLNNFYISKHSSKHYSHFLQLNKIISKNYDWILQCWKLNNPNTQGLFVVQFGTQEPQQGCQMVCFQIKSTNLGKFWRSLDWKMFIYCMSIWIILWTLGIFYDYLVHYVFIWYIFSALVSCKIWKIWQPWTTDKISVKLN
jgi:hypothetical protein